MAREIRYNNHSVLAAIPVPRLLSRASEVSSPYSYFSASLSFAAHAASSHDFSVPGTFYVDGDN